MQWLALSFCDIQVAGSNSVGDDQAMSSSEKYHLKIVFNPLVNLDLNQAVGSKDDKCVTNKAGTKEHQDVNCT